MVNTFNFVVGRFNLANLLRPLVFFHYLAIPGSGCCYVKKYFLGFLATILIVIGIVLISVRVTAPKQSSS